MNVQSALKRLALVGFLLVVPAVAVWSLNSEPSTVLAGDNGALVSASDLLVEQAANPSAPASVNGSTADVTVTLPSWEDTDHGSDFEAHPTPRRPTGPRRGPPPWAHSRGKR